MNNIYVIGGIVLVVLGAISVAISRMRRTPSIDQVPQNVLDRIRTEYR